MKSIAPFDIYILKIMQIYFDLILVVVHKLKIIPLRHNNNNPLDLVG